MLKRHLRLQRTVEEYGRNIKQLASRAQGLLAAGHPEGYVCSWGIDRSWASGQGPHHPCWCPDWPGSISCLGFV